MKAKCDFCQRLIKNGEDILVEKEKIYCLECWNKLRKKQYREETDEKLDNAFEELETERKSIEKKFQNGEIQEGQYLEFIKEYNQSKFLQEIINQPKSSFSKEFKKNVFLPKEKAITILNEENYKKAIKVLKKRQGANK